LIEGYDGQGFNTWRITFKMIGQEDFYHLRNACINSGFRNCIRATRATLSKHRSSCCVNLW
jgi:hypothetical protein